MLVAIGLAAVGLSRSLRRVEVYGSSMAPTMLPGDRLVVAGPPWLTAAALRPGDVIAVRDPREAQRVLVKRIHAVHASDGTLEVVGDAPDASTDSRTFGPVAQSSVVGRVIYRYAPPARRGPVDQPGEYDRR